MVLSRACPAREIVGLDEAKILKYIKNQQMNESIMDEYDSDLDKDPFKGAGIKEENDKEPSEINHN